MRNKMNYKNTVYYEMGCLFIILIACYCTAVSASTWEQIGIEGQNITFVAMGPSDNSLMYAGSRDLYKSTNSGDSWDYVSTLPEQCHYIWLNRDDKQSIILGNNTFLTGSDLCVYKSNDGGISFQKHYLMMEDGIPLKDSKVFKIHANPHDSTHLYAFTRRKTSNSILIELFESNDYGNTWEIGRLIDSTGNTLSTTEEITWVNDVALDPSGMLVRCGEKLSLSNSGSNLRFGFVDISTDTTFCSYTDFNNDGLFSVGDTSFFNGSSLRTIVADPQDTLSLMLSGIATWVYYPSDKKWIPTSSHLMNAKCIRASNDKDHIMCFGQTLNRTEFSESSDNGKSWTSYEYDRPYDYLSFNFEQYLLYNHKKDRVYTLMGNGLNMSEDRGKTWVSGTTGLPSGLITHLEYEPNSATLAAITFNPNMRKGEMHYKNINTQSSKWETVAYRFLWNFNNPGAYTESISSISFGQNKDTVCFYSKDLYDPIGKIGVCKYQKEGVDRFIEYPMIKPLYSQGTIKYDTVNNVMWVGGAGQQYSPFTLELHKLDPKDSTKQKKYIIRDDIIMHGEANAFLQKKFVSSIILDPQNNQRLLVAGMGGIYSSLNGGENWSNIYAIDSTKCMTAMIMRGDSLYATGPNGLSFSFDKGQTWESINFPGLNHLSFSENENTLVTASSFHVYKVDVVGKELHCVSRDFDFSVNTITSLACVGSDVYVGTAGHGVLKRNINAVNVINASSESKNLACTLSKNFYLLIKDKEIKSFSVEIFDVKGRVIFNHSYQNVQQVDLAKSFLGLASGVYFISINSMNSRNIIKVHR